MKKRVSQLLLLALIVFTNVAGFASLGARGDQIALALLLLVLAARAWDLLHAALLVLLLRTAHHFLPAGALELPAMGFLLPLLFSTALVALIPPARPSLRWVRRGRLDRFTRGAILLTGILSTAALIAWASWTDNLGIGEKMMAGALSAPSWLILAFGVPAFALVNALAEEAVYRGVAQEALCATFSSPALVIVLQASAFAAAHVRFGFPNGLVGYAMVFVYAGMLGYLRHRSRGMLAPYLTHVLADLTIGYFLYLHAL